MAAVGKVTIGFSKPYIAKYTVADGVVTYTDCQRLARGVSVTASPESSDNNNFYADNIVAESDSGSFTGGTVTYTVDGLLQDAEALIQGLPAADADGFINYDDDQAIPYLGTGFLIETMSDNVRYWTPVIFTKVSANQIENEAETEGEEIDWQTQEIEFTLFKDDTAKHCWKRVGGEMATEAAAEAALVAALGG